MPHEADKGLDILLDGFQCNRHYTFTVVKTAIYFVSFYLATESTIVTSPFQLSSNKSLPAWCEGVGKREKTRWREIIFMVELECVVASFQGCESIVQ